MKKYEGDKKDEEEDLGLIDKLVYSQWTNDVSCNRQKVFFPPGKCGWKQVVQVEGNDDWVLFFSPRVWQERKGLHDD